MLVLELSFILHLHPTAFQRFTFALVRRHINSHQTLPNHQSEEKPSSRSPHIPSSVLFPLPCLSFLLSLPFLFYPVEERFGEISAPLPPLLSLYPLFFLSFFTSLLFLPSLPLFLLPCAFISPSFPLAICPHHNFPLLWGDPPAGYTSRASSHLDPKAKRCLGPLAGCFLLRFWGPFPGCILLKCWGPLPGCFFLIWFSRSTPSPLHGNPSP